MPPPRHHRFAIVPTTGMVPVVLLIATLVVFFLAPVIVGGQVLLPLDLLNHVDPWPAAGGTDAPPLHNPLISDALWEAYPMAVQAATLWRDGLPLWDPTATIGMPALAAGKMYTNPLYVLLVRLVDPARAMSWAAVLHLLIAGLGMAVLLRELGTGRSAALVGALAFAFNGYLLVWLSLTYFVGTMVWTPWLVWAIERAGRQRDARYLVVAAAVFAVQVLSGFVLFAAHAALIVTIVFGVRGLRDAWRGRSPWAGVPRAGYGALAILGGMGLVAFQLLPAFELYRLSERGDQQFGTLMPVHEMIRLVLPRITGYPLAEAPYDGAVNYAETTLYFGIIPLICVLAALAVPRRGHAGLFFAIGLGYWLAVFGLRPFHDLAGWLTPGFHGTFAGRTFFIVAFCWSVAAGLGADALVRAGTRGSRRPLVLGIAGACLLFLLIHSVAHWWPADEPPPVPAARSTFVFLLVVAGLCAALASRRVPRAWVGVMLVTFTAVDLLRAHQDWNPTFDGARLASAPPQIETLLAHTEENTAVERGPAPPPRVLTIPAHRTLPGMTAQAFGLSNVNGYSSWLLRRYSRYAEASGDRAQARRSNRLSWVSCCGPLLDALALDAVLAATEAPRLNVAGSLLQQLHHARDRGVHAAVTPRRIALSNTRYRDALFMHAPSRIAVPLGELVPVGSRPVRFTAALGVDWRRCPLTDGVRFDIRLRPATGPEQPRFSHFVPRGPDLPRWLPIDVPLSLPADWHPDDRIVLVTRPGPRDHEQCDWAYWADPVVHTEPTARPPLRRVTKRPNPIYQNRNSLERVRLVHEVVAVSDGDLDAAEAALRDLGDRIDEVAVVEGEAPTLGPRTRSDQARIITFEADRLTVDVRTRHAALLVLAEAFHPGWRARIDGRPAPVLATNLALRGVPVPAGRHRVVLTFRPTSFRIGVAISLLTVLVVAATLVIEARRRRDRPVTDR